MLLRVAFTVAVLAAVVASLLGGWPLAAVVLVVAAVALRRRVESRARVPV